MGPSAGGGPGNKDKVNLEMNQDNLLSLVAKKYLTKLVGYL